MNSKVQNQLNMVGACISVAQSPDYHPVWNGREPAGFSAEFQELLTDYGAITAKAARAEAAAAGAAQTKAEADSTLEDATYVLARALAMHFRKIGDLDRLGRVNISRNQIQRLRSRALLERATAIRTVAAEALGEPGAEGRGVTQERLDALTVALAAFNQVIDLPRGRLVNRNTVLKEVERDLAALLERMRNLDDLTVQFDDTEAGREFIRAWRRARVIVDAGTGHGAGGIPAAAPAPASASAH